MYGLRLGQTRVAITAPGTVNNQRTERERETERESGQNKTAPIRHLMKSSRVYKRRTITTKSEREEEEEDARGWAVDAAHVRAV
jgi:hypothetical protein